MTESAALGVVGAGYVGLVTAACFARLGHEVWCVDIDREKVAALQRGVVALHEPGLTEAVHEHADRLHFGTDLGELFAHARTVFVCVDTPPTPSGDADLSRVEAVIDALPAAATGALLIMKSTVPVGTAARLRRTLDERGLTEVAYASNPEFLREGSAMSDFLEPDRVVIAGDAEEAAGRVAALYRSLTDRIVITDLASAEMIKYASNCFLATKISFINEIANVCEEVGADVAEVARGMSLDSRIGASFLQPGVGYGGSCFPKDVAALKNLAGNSGYHFQLLAAVTDVNALQKRRLVQKLKRHLGSLQGRRVALWGLAFKPNTSDMREASSVVLAGRLVAEGVNVVAYDPIVDAALGRLHLPPEVTYATSALDAADGADAVVLVTEWPQLIAAAYDGALRDRMAGRLLIDGRNALDPAAVLAAGLVYEGVGRPGDVAVPAEA